MKRLWKQYVSLLKDRDSGTVAVTFILSLPIFLLVIGMIVQYALMINARITINRAAAAAARSAMTSFPTDPDVDTVTSDNNGEGAELSVDGVAYVNKAARLVLAPISPQSANAVTSEAQEVTDALHTLGVPVVKSFDRRYSFAEEATTMEWTRVDTNNVPITETPWQPLQFAQNRGQRIKLTIHYNFLLNVPVIKHLTGHQDTVAGVSGQYMTFDSSIIVQLAPGRETHTDGTGWPQFQAADNGAPQ